LGSAAAEAGRRASAATASAALRAREALVVMPEMLGAKARARNPP
jgi:hypothetical protein